MVRLAAGFADAAFARAIAKYVRKDHVQTDGSFRRTWKKAALGPALPAPAVLTTRAAPAAAGSRPWPCPRPALSGRRSPTRFSDPLGAECRRLHLLGVPDQS